MGGNAVTACHGDRWIHLADVQPWYAVPRRERDATGRRRREPSGSVALVSRATREPDAAVRGPSAPTRSEGRPF